MKMYHYPTGPCITAQIYLHAEKITQIVLHPHPEDGINWRIVSEQPNSLIEAELDAWFKAYSVGKSSWNELPFSWANISRFTRDVLNAISEIPFGKVVTYQELAKSIGRPKATRAVGSACGRNPFPWIIPCHRVLASGYQLGG